MAQDLADPKALLSELTGYSLTDVSFDAGLQRPVYQNDAQVRLWLQQRKGRPAETWYRSAAQYQVYLLETDRTTVDQALVAHQTLVSANMIHEANGIVSDYVIRPFTLRGLYHVLLETWMPPVAGIR